MSNEKQQQQYPREYSKSYTVVLGVDGERQGSVVFNGHTFAIEDGRLIIWNADDNRQTIINADNWVYFTEEQADLYGLNVKATDEQLREFQDRLFTVSADE